MMTFKNLSNHANRVGMLLGRQVTYQNGRKHRYILSHPCGNLCLHFVTLKDASVKLQEYIAVVKKVMADKNAWYHQGKYTPAQALAKGFWPAR